MSDIVLITGAAGRTAGYVIKALLDTHSFQSTSLRLLVRSDASIERLRTRFPQLQSSSFVIGDYLESHTLVPAFRGADIVFHNGPAFHPQETAMGIAVIDAARETGVNHFVFCSVLFPILTKLLNHKVKRDIEEYLIESGLDYTILQPTSFMQNLNIKSAVATSVLPVGYSPKVLQGFLDLEDLAEIARLVLLNPFHHNRARYELVGQNCTLEDVATDLSCLTEINKVSCEQMPRSEVVARAIVPNKPQSAYAAEALDRMLYYYDKRGIPGNTNTLRCVLGREPTTWERLIQRELGRAERA